MHPSGVTAPVSILAQGFRSAMMRVDHVGRGGDDPTMVVTVFSEQKIVRRE